MSIITKVYTFLEVETDIKIYLPLLKIVKLILVEVVAKKRMF